MNRGLILQFFCPIGNSLCSKSNRKNQKNEQSHRDGTEKIMKKTFRNITLFALALAMLIGTTLFTGCGKSKKQIIIYTSGEDFRIEYMQQRMKEQFPDYDVIFEYKSSGDHAAILKSALFVSEALS